MVSDMNTLLTLIFLIYSNYDFKTNKGCHEQTICGNNTKDDNKKDI